MSSAENSSHGAGLDDALSVGECVIRLFDNHNGIQPDHTYECEDVGYDGTVCGLRAHLESSGITSVPDMQAICYKGELLKST